MTTSVNFLTPTFAGMGSGRSIFFRGGVPGGAPVNSVVKPLFCGQGIICGWGWVHPSTPLGCSAPPCQPLGYCVLIDHRAIDLPVRRCRSSVVEHSLGKGEVESSILSGSTIIISTILKKALADRSLRTSGMPMLRCGKPAHNYGFTLVERQQATDVAADR